MENDSLLLSECRSFWKGYRFHDTEKEQQFQNRYLPDLLRFCQVWCVINVAFSVLTPFSTTSYDFSFALYLAHVPGIATYLGLLILVSCFPSSRRHILFWVSAATVLTAASRGSLVHFQSGALLCHHFQDELGEVMKEVSDNMVAMDQLESFLGRRTIISVLNAQLAMVILNFLLLACAGFAQSTLWSCVLQPVVFLAGLLMSPDVRMHMSVVPVRCGGLFIAYVLLLVRMRSDSLTRRRTFILQRYFQVALGKAVESSRKADSILNHTLKNYMADGAGEIELFLDRVDGEDPMYAELHSATISLQRGMRACRQRQAYLQLTSGDYRLSLHPVELETFAKQITAGRAMTTEVPSLRVLLDCTLLGLIFDNAISNAFKHGHTEHPDVKLAIQNMANVQEQPEQLVMLSFRVTNMANPQRPPLTQEYISNVLAGKGQQGRPTSAISDQIGLQHTYLAAEAHGMTISFAQTGPIVQLELQVQAEVLPTLDSAEHQRPSRDLSAFPPNRKICCIDDSGTARRLLHHNLITWAQTNNVKVFGQEVSEVDLFVSEVLAGAHIAILDQHLEYGGNNNVLGTDIARRLVAQGYSGLMCIRSANMASEDQEQYAEAGAHCWFGKDMIMKDMVKALKAAYLDSIVRDTSSDSTCATVQVIPGDAILRDAPVEPCTSPRSAFTVPSPRIAFTVPRGPALNYLSHSVSDELEDFTE